MLPKTRTLIATLMIAAGCGEPGDALSSASDASDSDASNSTDGDGSSTASEPAPTTTESSGGDSDADTSAVGPTTGDPSGPGTSTDGDTNGDTDGGTTGEEPSPWDGEPLPLEPPGNWSWVDFPDSMCRDGSTTGIGVRYGTSDKLVIYFEGGGACFNAATCILNDLFSNWGEIKFNTWALGIGKGGIFSDDPQNPVRDWNFIYVPYCTGDVHAGNRENVGINGVLGAQQFVGYRNVAAYLERIVPTFKDTSHVLVTGISAGGFGAALNYDRIAEAFPKSTVTLLDDSGPPMGDQYMPVCLQKLWRELYNFDETLPPDCVDCFNDDGGGISNLAAYLGDKWGEQRLALFSNTRDNIIRTFFGYGLNNCAGGTYGGSQFEQGLFHLRDEILGDSPTWGSYFIDGIGHTVLAGPAYFTTKVDNIPLTEWIEELLAGNASHVGP